MSIKEDLIYFQAIYNDFGKITDSILVKFDYPNNIKKFIKTNLRLIKKKTIRNAN
jgi:hypothetical protein